LATGGLASAQQVFPTTPHVANNFIPFGSNASTMHQVFDEQLFSSATGGLPARIDLIGFAPNASLAVQTFTQPVTINLGYTNRVPGQPGPVGLSVPVMGGGGNPNATGAMTTFFDDPAWSHTVSGGGTEVFDMTFAGSFVYDPALGNLLVEIVSDSGPVGTFLSVSRTGGSSEASRAFDTVRFGTSESNTTATRMEFTFVAIPGPGALGALAVAGLLGPRRRRR
jgi:hypothetical protein